MLCSQNEVRIYVNILNGFQMISVNQLFAFKWLFYYLTIMLWNTHIALFEGSFCGEAKPIKKPWLIRQMLLPEFMQ